MRSIQKLLKYWRGACNLCFLLGVIHTYWFDQFGYEVNVASREYLCSITLLSMGWLPLIIKPN